MTFDYAGRRSALAARLASAGLDLLFVPGGTDLEYLTGVERDAPTYGATVYTHGWVTGAFFRTDAEPVFCLPRLVSLVHVKIPLPGELVVFDETADDRVLFAQVKGLLGAQAPGWAGTVGVAGRASAETLLRLQSELSAARFVDATPLLDDLRARKSSEELVALTEATRVAHEALARTMPLIEPGVTMRQIATELERQMTELGSRGPSFVTHIATYGLADRRDNLNETADLPLRSGESLKFDYGAVVDGYCSDFGRTLFIGEPSADFLTTYNEVLIPAHEAAIAACVPGARAGDVDLICRKVIEDAGFGEAFVHRAGHCLGLDLHERPYISEEDDLLLDTGMVFTIEPSINVPQRFGMRIEDMVVCEPSGGRKLIDLPSDLVII